MVCVGNRLRGDDAAGLEVARHLRGTLPADVEITEREGEPTALISGWEGVEALWIVDAVSSESATGTVHRLDASDRALPPDPFRASTHHVSLAETVELARALGRLPAQTVVYGIEGGSFAVGEPLTPGGGRGGGHSGERHPRRGDRGVHAARPRPLIVFPEPRATPLIRALRGREGALEMTATATERVLLDEESLQRTLRRIAHEIVEKHPDLTALGLVGIYTRGATLAQRLRDLIEEYTGTRVPTGALDITFYRDDVTLRAEQRAHPQPVVKATRLDFPLEGKSVVVVDDVLYTGRTIRSAIEAIFDYGRPERVQLAVLVDRGHRELPIRPDYVGKNLPTARSERVNVELVEVDEVDRVVLIHP